MRNTLRKQNAITLVALIITIIVLLILAMVSISLVMNSGIINKSKTAVDKYSQEEIQEQIKLAYSEWEIAKWTENAGDAATFMQGRLRTALNDNSLTVTGSEGVFVVKLSNNEKYIYDVKAGGMLDEVPVSAYPIVTASTNNSAVPENSKYVSNNKIAVIPAGYAISNLEAEQSIDTGLVISKDGNEWVWIPVADVTDLYTENTTEIPWTLCGTSGDNKVVTLYKSKSEILSGKTRTTPGTTTDYREPDTVVGDGTEYDAVQVNYEAAGFSSLNDMATKLKDDYKKMIDSVRKYGGFYVGRYELSSAGTKKSQTVLTNTNWYNLYAACKGIDNTNTSIEIRMIWGCQWDQICKFISTSGDQVSITDSTSYGNYSNSTVEGHGSKRVTGYSESWKANNIYDIAGNCYEWTQEAVGTDDRAYRGGYYYSYGGDSPVTDRNLYNPAYSSYGGVSSRPVLYLK